MGRLRLKLTVPRLRRVLAIPARFTRGDVEIWESDCPRCKIGRHWLGMAIGWGGHWGLRCCECPGRQTETMPQDISKVFNAGMQSQRYWKGRRSKGRRCYPEIRKLLGSCPRVFLYCQASGSTTTAVEMATIPREPRLPGALAGTPARNTTRSRGKNDLSLPFNLP